MKIQPTLSKQQKPIQKHNFKVKCEIKRPYNRLYCADATEIHFYPSIGIYLRTDDAFSEIARVASAGQYSKIRLRYTAFTVYGNVFFCPFF